jgi:putative ATP-dependent endonuclease of the OLD family
MRRYLPSAAIRLDPVAQQLKIAPLVQLRGGEEQNLTDLGRQGHGFQRTFIIAALEYLAATQDSDEGDRPWLFLAIEEPELYQHPPRAMHFANTLQQLASKEGSSVQVCYATHSPYFVSPSDFASVRIFRRVPQLNGPSSTTITAASEKVVAAKLPEDQRGNLRGRLARTLRSSFREAFFAQAVLLLEGDTDVAVFGQAARMSGNDLWGYGVVPVPVTKSVVPIAYAILTSLAIPTYVLFDGDERASGKESCDACGRGGRDPSNDALQNRRILEMLGEPGQDFPTTQHNGRWGCFATDLEGYLVQELEGFDTTAQKVAQELGWKRKSAEVYSETLERLGHAALPSMLVEVPQAVLALAGTSPDP